MTLRSIRVWQGFTEWRSQLYRALGQVDLYYLKLLRDDLRRVLEEIEREIAARGS